MSHLVGFLFSACFVSCSIATAAVRIESTCLPVGESLTASASRYRLAAGQGGPLAALKTADADKIVLFCASAGEAPVAVTAITYGDRAMREAAAANSDDDKQFTGIYYLDAPLEPGALEVAFDGPRQGVELALVSLSGTAPGVAASATAIGLSAAALAQVPAGSLALFSHISAESGGWSAASALQPLVHGAADSAAIGYEEAATAGPVRARFSRGRAGPAAVTLGVAFASATAAPPPGPAEPIRQSHDWGLELEGFQDHAYLSAIGTPTPAPENPTDTWVQYLSGKDKDDTVAWDFYCTKWGRMRQWSRLPVPSCWEMHGFGRLTYYDEDSGEKGSYNYRFRVPASWKDTRRVTLVFEGVSLETYVYVNGKPVADAPHAGGFYRFSYDITDHLDFTGINLLEVHVDNDSPTHPGLVEAEGGDYWRFGGIFRPVYLEAKPLAHIAHCTIDARANGRLRAEVELAGIRQAGTLTARVIGPDGEPHGEPVRTALAAGQRQVALDETFPQPQPWSAEFPHLYHLELGLDLAGTPTHRLRERFGFRTVEVRPGEGFFVNGVKIILRGVNRHTCWPDTGKTVSRAIDRLDLERMKEMNLNAVRAGHYPPDRSFIELCDEMGFYVLEELASCQDLLPTQTGIPLVRSMIRRDGNSPSVILWANGNEDGHNPELDPYFKQADLQKRPVVYSRHGREPVDGIITDHYEPYAGIEEIIAEKKIFIATEIAHGLYDGGGGAGLEDRWEKMMQAPLTQGVMIWTLLDEAIRRPNLGGCLDSSGNQAPDGLLGPYREREGSFFTVQELFCPIHVSMRELPDDFSGRIEIENRYNFTNVDQCRFAWELVTFRRPDDAAPGHVVDHRGALGGPSIPPGSNPDFHRGWLELDLPADWAQSDALRLTAIDPYGKDLWTWSWVTASASDTCAAIVKSGPPTPVRVIDRAAQLILSSPELEVAFDRATGHLVAVRSGGREMSFGQGPVLVHGDQQLRSIQADAQASPPVVEAVYDGAMRSATWSLQPGGWLRLDYHYHLTGEAPFMGISFDYPESEVQSMTWLGQGPFRVWKNRLRGGRWDVWEKNYNQTATGFPGSVDPYDYPEFKGYHANVRWVKLVTTEGDILCVADDDALFFRNFTADYGIKPRDTDPPFPRGDLSFLDGIHPQGNKIRSIDAPAMGPQGEPNQARGDYRRTLFFRFTPSS